MKLVIQTQIQENYGAHDWNGEGECPQYWKFKGGNTYVVENLSEKHAAKINNNGIPTITSLITETGDYFKEYVLSFEIVADDEIRWEEWETPITLSWSIDRWLADRTVRNDNEFSYMRSDILAKREEWIPLEGGERGHYKCEYLTDSGWVQNSHLAA
jgi:hypothetical protein